MKFNRTYAVLQLVFGVLATLLVAIGFFKFNRPLQGALKELDSLAGIVESELETVSNLINDVDKVVESVEAAVPSHRKTLASAVDSSMAIANAVEAWEEKIPGFQDVATDAAQICDTFAEQLPITIPAVSFETKTVHFRLPEVIPKTRSVSIPYPTAKVNSGPKRITYPKGAAVMTKEWKTNFGKVLGKDLGGVSFSYPAGINVSNGSVDLAYPTSIKIGTANKTVSIPATPELRMKDHRFDIPDNLSVSKREFMKDEQVLLRKSSTQLMSMHTALGTTAGSLSRIRRTLGDDVSASLQETDRNLVEMDKALKILRRQRIPRVVSDLAIQRQGLAQSRSEFGALAGLIPLLFAISGLVTSAIAISGVGKLFS